MRRFIVDFFPSTDDEVLSPLAAVYGSIPPPNYSTGAQALLRRPLTSGVIASSVCRYTSGAKSLLGANTALPESRARSAVTHLVKSSLNILPNE